MPCELNLRSTLKRALVSQKGCVAACDPGMKGERVSSQTFLTEKIQGTGRCRGSWSLSLEKAPDFIWMGKFQQWHDVTVPKSVQGYSTGSGMEPLGHFLLKRLFSPCIS